MVDERAASRAGSGLGGPGFFGGEVGLPVGPFVGGAEAVAVLSVPFWVGRATDSVLVVAGALLSGTGAEVEAEAPFGTWSTAASLPAPLGMGTEGSVVIPSVLFPSAEMEAGDWLSMASVAFTGTTSFGIAEMALPPSAEGSTPPSAGPDGTSTFPGTTMSTAETTASPLMTSSSFSLNTSPPKPVPTAAWATTTSSSSTGDACFIMSCDPMVELDDRLRSMLWASW